MSSIRFPELKELLKVAIALSRAANAAFATLLVVVGSFIMPSVLLTAFCNNVSAFWVVHCNLLETSAPSELIIISCPTFSSSISLASSILDAESITLNKEEVEIAPGQSIILTATLLPANHMDSVVWTSSNSSVATVSETGMVKGINGGEAVVTATTGSGKTATCLVKVISPTITLGAAADSGQVSITLNVANVIIEEGQVINLVYAVYKDNRMTGIKIKSPAVIDGAFNDSETIDYEISKVPDTCKLFILKNSDLMPVTNKTTKLVK